MIVDSLAHLKDYLVLHSDMEAIWKFLSSDNVDLENLPDGKMFLDGTDVSLNVQTITSKNESEARLESHRKMIDIQIPLTGDEKIGYAPVAVLGQAPYDEDKDITFYTESADGFVTIRKGMFALFFPQDAHAPGVTSTGLKKMVIKLPVTNMKKL